MNLYDPDRNALSQDGEAHLVIDEFAWINKYTCRFAVNGNNVTILSSPSEFYEHLMVI